MAQEYKIISENITTGGGITDIETTYISTTAASITFSAITATFYGNGSNLANVTDNYVTGGTYSNGTLTLNRQNGSVVVTGFSTGSTGTDTYVTGFTYNNSNRLTISQNNNQPNLNVFINTMSGLTITGLINATNIIITGSTAGQEFNLYRYSNDNQAGGILSYKARGTVNSPTAILTGDTIAVMGGRGYFGTGFTSTSKANISFIASENWSSTNQGVYISFNTTPAGSTTRSEVARLDNNGLNVVNNITGSSIVITSPTGFKLGSSTTAGYVLTTDANGNGTWQVTSATGATGTAATSGQTNDGTSNTLFVSPLGLKNSSYITQYGNKVFSTASGTNTYTVTLSPSITGLTTGCVIYVKFTSANTTTGCTLNVDSLGAKNIVKYNATTLVTGDILANGLYTLIYDGNNWVIIGCDGSLRSFDWVDFPARVISTVAGSAPTISLTTNTRILRTLTRATGTNQNTIFYWMFYIPKDFVAFPTNAFKIESSRNTANATLSVTFGSAGVADSTINGLSLIATGTGDVIETKTATPGSTYRPGDLVLVSANLAVTTSNGNLVRLGMAGLDYIARI